MSEPDVAIIVASYNAARAEILERVRLREGIVIAFVTASVTIFGGALALRPTPADFAKFSFVTPFLSLVAALAIAQHNFVIEQIADFLRARLDPYFRNSSQEAIHWDGHTRIETAETERQKTSFKFLYHLVAIHGPCAVSLVIGWITFLGLNDTNDTPRDLATVFWLATSASIMWGLAIYVTYWPFRKRFIAIRAKRQTNSVLAKQPRQRHSGF